MISQKKFYFQPGRLCYSLSIFILLAFSSLNSLERKDARTPMTTSVIVPCHYKHFPLINELLEYYRNQTVLPDEIVISVSECNLVPEEMISSVEANHWPFDLTILLYPEKLAGGQNRNRASVHSSGDILLCQDADDIPHPQRVEIVKSLFEQYKIDHLIHGYIFPDHSFLTYNPKYLERICKYYSYLFEWKQTRTTSGNVCYTREVCDTIQWPEYAHHGEDVDFNEQVYNRFNYKVMLKIPLLLYRIDLSVYGSTR